MKAVILLLLAFVAFASADIWTNCGSAGDHLKISTVTITPDPPVAGQNITVAASGVLDEDVTNGTISLDIKYDGFITIIKKDFDICADPDFPCPIKSGDYSQTVSELIPASAPAGDYSGQVTVTDQNGQEITCISLAFKL